MLPTVKSVLLSFNQTGPVASGSGDVIVKFECSVCFSVVYVQVILFDPL